MDVVKENSPIDGEEADDSEDSEYSDDEFIPVPSTNHPGHKMALVRWFQETQATQIYDPSQENFIAEWFHGVISRRQSEELLKNKTMGTFLIRVSKSRFGHTLSFRAETRVRHYMIDQLRNKKFIIIGEPKVHKTLKDIIDYHKQNEIYWEGVLTESCGQESDQCDYGDLVDDRFYFTLEEQLARQIDTNITTLESPFEELKKRRKDEINRLEDQLRTLQSRIDTLSLNRNQIPAPMSQRYSQGLQQQQPSPGLSQMLGTNNPQLSPSYPQQQQGQGQGHWNMSRQQPMQSPGAMGIQPQVTRTSITSRTSSKLGQIGPRTAELAALESLEKSP